MNDFSHIDAQDGVSRLSQLSPEEIEEANAYYDELVARDSAGDEVPMDVDGSGGVQEAFEHFCNSGAFWYFIGFLVLLNILLISLIVQGHSILKVANP